MTARKHQRLPEARIAVDFRCYDREAVVLAASLLSRSAEVFIECEGKTCLELSVRPVNGSSLAEAWRLAGELLNEALNQDLRLRLAKSRQDLLTLLTAQALGAAAGGAGRTAADEQAQQCLDAQARQFMAQAGKTPRGGRQQ